MQRGNLAPVINRGPSNNVENRETFDSRNQVESNFIFFFFFNRGQNTFTLRRRRGARTGPL